jgi:5-methylcytosine-specific restriction protein A
MSATIAQGGKCIERYGYKCAVCCFDFYDTYGNIGEGFVHVHHLIPFYKVGKQYKVDPVKDLRPVCPNCHAMLHRSGGEMTIDSLRKALNPKLTPRK